MSECKDPMKATNVHGESKILLHIIGIPGSGKSSLAEYIVRKLKKSGENVLLYDGDYPNGSDCSDPIKAQKGGFPPGIVIVFASNVLDPKKKYVFLKDFTTIHVVPKELLNPCSLFYAECYRSIIIRVGHKVPANRVFPLLKNLAGFKACGIAVSVTEKDINAPFAIANSPQGVLEKFNHMPITRRTLSAISSKVCKRLLERKKANNFSFDEYNFPKKWEIPDNEEKCYEKGLGPLSGTVKNFPYFRGLIPDQPSIQALTELYKEPIGDVHITVKYGTQPDTPDEDAKFSVVSLVRGTVVDYFVVVFDGKIHHITIKSLLPPKYTGLYVDKHQVVLTQVDECVSDLAACDLTV